MAVITINGKARDAVNNLFNDMIMSNVEEKVANRRLKNVVKSAFARAYEKSLPIKGSEYKSLGVFTGKLKRTMGKKTSYRVSTKSRRYRERVSMTIVVDVKLPKSGQVLGDGQNVTSNQRTALTRELIAWAKGKGIDNPVSSASKIVNGWIAKGKQPAAAPKWYDPKHNNQLRTNLRNEVVKSVKRSIQYNRRL